MGGNKLYLQQLWCGIVFTRHSGCLGLQIAGFPEHPRSKTSIHKMRALQLKVRSDMLTNLPDLVRAPLFSPFGFRGYIGRMENKMEATIVCWGYIGIEEKKMETIIH